MEPWKDVPTKKIRSIGELLSVSRSERDAWSKGEPEEVWFRGHRKQSWKLEPNFYRDRTKSLIDEERTLFRRFQALAPTYLPREPLDKWDWYFTMQHYGVPTRLLDWSESPLVAAYFALEKHFPQPIPGPVLSRSAGHAEASSPAPATEPPCVWMMDAGALNSISVLEDEWLRGGQGGLSECWEPCGLQDAPSIVPPKEVDGQSFDRTNEKPIAIHPRRSTTRIVAQHGMFTIHGVARGCLSGLFAGAAPERQRIMKLVIPDDAKRAVWDQLQDARINKLALFPEPANLADFLSRLYEEGSTA